MSRQAFKEKNSISLEYLTAVAYQLLKKISVLRPKDLCLTAAAAGKRNHRGHYRENCKELVFDCGLHYLSFACYIYRAVVLNIVCINTMTNKIVLFTFMSFGRRSSNNCIIIASKKKCAQSCVEMYFPTGKS